jgi:YbbR domain-containing protein
MIWRILTRNLGWKLGSLALSVLLWFAVVGEPELTTVQSVPVFYQNVTPGLLLDPDAPDTLEVELRGTSGSLTHDNLSSIRAVVNLSAIAQPGQQTFTISSKDVSLPQGVTFLSAVPSQLRLQLERPLSKDVPVQIHVIGEPAEGYAVTQEEADPPTLRITGPEGRVRKAQGALTDAIDISGKTQSLEVKVNTFLSDPRLQLESPSLVTVGVTIEKVPAGKGAAR